ncbi:MAG TPA: Gfo/Idh/MocA family oxidoreductase [Vicinamibacterales bacterium]|nr:Gfo/Idh/MocA family oxidoreductase [Vicinamibacterales bacterium]
MNASRHLRWGLLSTARINRRLIPAMRACARSAITAVASRTLSRARTFAREWDIPIAVEGYRSLLDRDDVDAVYIPLPNSLHAEWTLKAIAAGKHVLCEKPLATNPADVDRMQAAALATGVIVEEGFMYRHEPLTDQVVALVSAGAVGAVRAVVSGFTYARNRPDDVRLSASLGGGALLDVGCYPVSYACLLAGSAALSATATARFLPDGVDEELAGVLRFRGDRMASIYAGFRAAYRTWLDVLGSEGSLSVPHPFKPDGREPLVLERLGDRRHIEVRGSELLFLRQVEHFVGAVIDGVPVTVTLDESRRVASALAALAASARQPEVEA